jgi:integrase
MSANFRLEPNGYLYLYHWINSDVPFKVSTKVKIKPEQWNKIAQQPIDPGLKDAKGVKIVNTLAKYRTALTDSLAEIKVTRKDLKTTFQNKLSGQIIRGGVSSVKFLEFYSEIIQRDKADGKRNWKSYQTTYNKLVKFFGRSRPTFDQINAQFYKDFTRYLEKESLKVGSIATYWNNIKFICGEAYLLKISSNTDYQQFNSIQPKDRNEEKVSVYLTISELDKIYNLNFKNHKRLEKVRDLFIIGANTGLRFSDWHKISSDLIKDDVIKLKAKKTNITSVIICNKYVIAILKKYNGKLPRLTNLNIVNHQLRTIGMTARLNEIFEINPTTGGKRLDVPVKLKKWELITTHTARRSLATNCILSGASPFIVQKITGHKSVLSLSKYVNLKDQDAVEKLKGLTMFQ